MLDREQRCKARVLFKMDVAKAETLKLKCRNQFFVEVIIWSARYLRTTEPVEHPE